MVWIQAGEERAGDAGYQAPRRAHVGPTDSCSRWPLEWYPAMALDLFGERGTSSASTGSRLRLGLGPFNTIQFNGHADPVNTT